jgi:p-aminobenzoyl-glutamate transporter AbgT
MASYKKYVMIGVTTILLPLGKWVLQKVISKLTEKPEQDSAAEETRSSLPLGGSLRGGHDNVGKRE